MRGVDHDPLRQAGVAQQLERVRRRPPGRSWAPPGRRAGSRGRRGCRWCRGSPACRRRRSRRRRAAPRRRATASTATWTSPSVRFLKPTGIERPEPSWRWIWLSVVRAPIAPQETASEMYCGVIGSRNSHADRQPEVEHLEQQRARHAQARVDVAGAVQVGVVDQALPAGRRARLLEVDAHRDQQVVAQLARALAPGRRRTRAPPPGRGRCTGRPRPAAGRRCRRGRCRPRRGPLTTVFSRSSPSGRSASSCAGETSSTIRSIRWSRTRSRVSPCIPIITLPSPSSTLTSLLPVMPRRTRRAAGRGPVRRPTSAYWGAALAARPDA